MQLSVFDSVREREILHVHLLHEAYFPSVYVALNGNVLLKCLKTSGFFFRVLGALQMLTCLER